MKEIIRVDLPIFDKKKNTNQIHNNEKTKKAETMFQPFSSLKPIKPIVDIQ